jgi:hypothetical protein
MKTSFFTLEIWIEHMLDIADDRSSVEQDPVKVESIFYTNIVDWYLVYFLGYNQAFFHNAIRYI